MRSLLLLFALLGCKDRGEIEADTDTDTDSDSDTDTDTDLGTISWRLHEDIESLVYVSWDQGSAGTAHVEYRFDEEWVSTPELSVEAGRAEALLLGIPYDTDVDFRVVSGSLTSDDRTASTGNLPSGLPVPELLSGNSDRWLADGHYLLGSINSETGGWTDGKYWMWIVDRQGRIVWAMPGEEQHFTIYLQVSRDNDILWDVSTYWSEFDNGALSRIHRMKIDGAISESYAAPGMHHCFIEMPDRSILWGSASGGNEKLKRRNSDGTTDTVWDCQPFYDQLGLDDWCHTNSIWLDEANDTLLLSFPTRDTFVLEVDVETGEELRWFGHIPQAWGFDPPQSAFEYQHGATYTDAGTLLVSSQVSPSSYEGVVREYELDDKGEILREVWSYGQGDGIEARYAGEAHRLSNGNTLHNTGTTPRVREITEDGEVVWDLAFEGSRLIGRTTWLEDLYTLAP